jgi:hypothetical protein
MRVLVIIAHMDHKTFHDLVDEIDIRQHRKCVLAGQLQAAEVGPATKKLLKRRSSDVRLSLSCFTRIEIVVAQELEQLDEIGRRAIDGEAFVALAIIQAAEQSRQVERHWLLIGDLLQRR